MSTIDVNSGAAPHVSRVVKYGIAKAVQIENPSFGRS